MFEEFNPDDPQELEYKKFVIETGGDYDMVCNLLKSYNFEQYKNLERVDYCLKFGIDPYNMPKDIKEEYEEYSNEMSKEDYINMKIQLSEQRKAFFASLKGNDNNLIIDYRPILNGNFDSVDKNSLTYEDKVRLNVENLPDETYDLYLDEDTGSIIPVYYDFATKNEKALLFAKYLKEFGEIHKIKMNWKCPLMLFDRALLGVDVDRKDLSLDIVRRQIEEGKINPFYHMREVARVLGKGSGKIEPFTMSISTYTTVWLYAQSFNTYKSGPRQVGKTFDISHLIDCYEFSYGSSDFTALILHYNAPSARKNKNDGIKSAELLPRQFRLYSLNQKKDKKTGTMSWVEGSVEMPKGDASVNKFLNNTIKIGAVGTSEEQAEKAGRGGTFRWVHIDEINFFKHPQRVMTACQLAHGTIANIIERYKGRYGIHITSTAGNLSRKSGIAMYKMIYEEMVMFEPKLFSFSRDELKKYLAANGKKAFFIVQYNYDEYGLDEEWLEQNRGLSGTDEEFRTDVLQHWLNTDDLGIFDKGMLDRIINKSEDWTKKFETSYFMDNIYKITYFPTYKDQPFEEFLLEHNTIGIGLDVSFGNATGDFQVLTAIDLLTGRYLFTFRSNVLNVNDLSQFISKFVASCIDVYKKNNKISRANITNTGTDLLLILNVERQGPGQALIPLLTSDPVVENILYREKKFQDSVRNEKELIKAYSKKVNNDFYKFYGTSMNRDVRNFLFGTVLFDLVANQPQAFVYSETASELRSLTKNNKGKIAAKVGYHDDCITSLLHAYSLIHSPHHVANIFSEFGLKIYANKLEVEPYNPVIDSFKDRSNSHFFKESLILNRIPKHDGTTGKRYFVPLIKVNEDGFTRELTKEEYECKRKDDLELDIFLSNVETDNKISLGEDYTRVILEDKCLKINSTVDGKQSMLIHHKDESSLFTKRNTLSKPTVLGSTKQIDSPFFTNPLGNNSSLNNKKKKINRKQLFL